MNLITFLVLIVVTSVVAHYFLKDRLFLASVIAAAVASLLFQVAGYLVQGYLDPFVLIALVVSFLVNLAIALLIGVTFRVVRRQKTQQRTSPRSLG